MIGTRRLMKAGRHAVARAGAWIGRSLPAWAAWVERHTGLEEDPHAAAPRPSSSDEDKPPDSTRSSPVRSGLPPLDVASGGALYERLSGFLEALRGATGSYAVFVADNQGLPLASSQATDDQVAITAALDRALQPIRATLSSTSQGSLAVEIERDNVLQVIWVNTDRGRYVLGMVLAQSLSGEFVDDIRSQLSPLFANTSQGTAA